MSHAAQPLQRSSRGISFIRSGSQNSKTTLVCIHGWACQASDFEPLLSDLSELGSNIQKIAVNLPGNANSSTAPCPDPTIPNVAGAVFDLLAELEVDDVVLVGHSMGVRVILEIWKQARAKTPPRIKGLVFLDGSSYKLRKTLFAFDRGDARSKDMPQETKIAGMIEAFERMFSNRTPQSFRESTLEHLGEMDLEYNERLRQAFIDYDYNDMDGALEALGRSGLLLLSFQATNVDEENHRIPLKPDEVTAWMKCVQEKVPQAQQFVVSDAMHFPHIDQPAVVARRLQLFLAELDDQFNEP